MLWRVLKFRQLTVSSQFSGIKPSSDVARFTGAFSTESLILAQDERWRRA